MVILSLLFRSPEASAQLYLEPNPINLALETQLLSELKHPLTRAKKIRVLLDLGNLYYNKPTRSPADLELGLTLTNQAILLSEEEDDADAYNYAQYIKANILLLKGHREEVDKIINLVNDSTKIKIMIALMDWYATFSSSPPSESAAAVHKILKQATRLCLKTGDKVSEIRCLEFRGLLYAIEDDPKNAELSLKEAVRQYQAIGHKKLQHVYYFFQLANMFSGNFDKALFYSFESIKAMEQSKDTSSAGDLYLLQARIYRHFNMKEESMKAALTALRYYRSHAGENNIFGAVHSVIRMLIAFHKNKEALEFLKSSLKGIEPATYQDKLAVINLYGDCYLALKRYDEAEKYYLRGYNMTKNANGLYLESYRRMGYYYIEVKDYIKAKPYLQKALYQLNIQPADIKSKIHLHYMAFLADSATGDYLSAIKHLRINNRYDDTLYKEQKRQVAQDLIAKYETQKKEDQIKLLSQNQKLQEASLHRANATRNVTIGGSFLIAFIAALLYRQIILKNKNNKIIAQKNQMLERLLTEKEWLLKEVHHRVKNNLHTVICLLESQAAYLENDALKAIESSQHRIFAMSLIHQKLYQSDDIRTIEMSVYIPELVQYLEDSFGSSEYIRFQLEISPISLNISKAIPLGLIINEAVTNSIKYAFPGKKMGIICISLFLEGGRMTLEISDNGIGMPLNTLTTKPESLGLKLIKGLTLDINGEISFESGSGTRIFISFEGDDLNIFDNQLKSMPERG